MGDKTIHKKIIIQGHRGARGLYPENTLNGFIEAVKLGVDTLEMDVVISKDNQVVISHEPWMNPAFCSKPDGSEIEKDSEEKYNLFKMDYAEIRQFDCGRKGNPEFPIQKKVAEYKPLLGEVILEIETYTKQNNLAPVIYNIEIKSEETADHIFQPEPAAFVKLVYDEIKNHNINDRVMLQSFDVRILKKLKELYPETKIGLLIENEFSLKKNLELLGFLPYTYNPYFHLITSELVKELHRLNIQTASWTVNETSDMQRLIDIGVDGIITDYPNKAIGLIKSI